MHNCFVKNLVRGSILGAALLTTGCYQARFERATTWSDYKVELYSGGQIVQEWTSSGKVISEDDNSFYFKDKETGKIVEISGDIVITQI